MWLPQIQRQRLFYSVEFEMKLTALFVAAAQAKENYIIGGSIVKAHSEPYILSLQEIFRKIYLCRYQYKTISKELLSISCIASFKKNNNRY